MITQVIVCQIGHVYRNTMIPNVEQTVQQHERT